MRLWQCIDGEKTSPDTIVGGAQSEAVQILFFLFHFPMSFYLPSNIPIRKEKIYSREKGGKTTEDFLLVN